MLVKVSAATLACSTPSSLHNWTRIFKRICTSQPRQLPIGYKETFGVSYTRERHDRGAAPARLRVQEAPAGAREAQEQFLATYDHIRNSKGQDDPIEKRKIAKYTVFIEK